MYFNKDLSMEKKPVGNLNKLMFPVDKIKLLNIIPFLLLDGAILAVIIPLIVLSTNGKSQLLWFIFSINLHTIIFIWFLYQTRKNKIKFSEVYTKQIRKIPVFIIFIFIVSKFSLVFLSSFLSSFDSIVRAAVEIGDINMVDFNAYISSNNIMIDIIITAFFAPVVEEILFRLVIMNKIKAIMGVGKAIIISAAIFGLLHLTNGIENAFYSFITGIIYAIIYEYTGSIKLTTILHIVNNALMILLLNNVHRILEGFFNLSITFEQAHSIISLGIVLSASYILIFTVKYASLIKKEREEEKA